MKNCIYTLIDVYNSTGFHEGCTIFTRFMKLRQTINDVDLNRITEQDVLKVEKATDAILAELVSRFKKGEWGPVYEGPGH